MDDHSLARPLVTSLALVSLGLAGCSSSDGDAPSSRSTITGSLSGLGLTTLATAVEAARLDDDLATAGPCTFFAPTNAAFEARAPATLPASDIQIGGDGMGGLVPSTDPGSSGNVDANVTGANVFANNAVIHVIDTVLVPPGFVLS